MRKQISPRSTLLLTVVLGLLVATSPVTGAEDAALADRLQHHAAWLADDARDGRGIGTPGLDSAAAYIQAHFEQAGLFPLFGKYYEQAFVMGWGARANAGSFVVAGADTLTLDEAMRPAGFSSTDTVSAPVVFAGFGISAGEYEYDDYAEIDASGKLVVVMDGEPRRDDPDGRFAGEWDTDHASPRTKAINARLHGAAGLLIVPAPGEPDSLPPLLAEEPYRNSGLPVAWITREAFGALFPRLDLNKLKRSIDLNEAPRSRAAGDSPLTLGVSLEHETVTVANVGAMIPGDERVIVFGAHYDHLGYGQSGSRAPGERAVHPGADDNASGVAVLLELASLLADKPTGPTIAFVAFTGEEAGLVGSSQFVRYPPVDLERIKLMVNLDMVGRMQDNKLTVYGVHSGTALEALATRAGGGLNLDLALTGGGYGASDQTSFYAAGVPVLHLLTSLHADYHRPSDQADKLNRTGMARVTRYAANLADEYTELDTLIDYVEAEAPAAPSGRHGTRSVSMGTIPDFAQPDSLSGFRIQGVTPGSPAARAGLTGGDVITAIGDILIDNIYDLTYALGRFKPDQTATVRWKRDGDTMAAELTFAAREEGGGGHPGGRPGGHPGADSTGGGGMHQGHGPDPGRPPHDATPDSSGRDHPQDAPEHPRRSRAE